MFVEQDPAALANLSAAVHALSVFEVAALHDLVCISGSLILGLAAARGSYPLDTLWTRSRIDEEWQIEQWGRDEEADALMETKCLAFENAAQFFEWVKN
jgi:chaperone required for assembly of F1-ATPase